MDLRVSVWRLTSKRQRDVKWFEKRYPKAKLIHKQMRQKGDGNFGILHEML